MANENDRLLDAPDDEADPDLRPAAWAPAMAKSGAAWSLGLVLDHLRTFRVLYIIGVFAFVIDMSFMMGAAPMTRLLELGICREHYRVADPSVIQPGGNVPEQLCKIGDVQSRLAEVNGYITMLAFLPGIFLSVPFGILADTYGRVIVAFAGIVGVSLGYIWLFAVLYLYETLPFSLVYVYPLFFCIGGGPPIIAALILAIITDVTPKEIRTTVYFYIHTVAIVTMLMGPPVGSILMEWYSPQTAFLWTIPPRVLSLALLFLIPETSEKKAPVPSASMEDAKSLLTIIRGKISNLSRHIVDNILPVISQLPVMLGLVAFIVNAIAGPLMGIVMQYMSSRFQWKLSQAAWVLSFQAAVQIVLLTTALPFVDRHLKRKHKSTERANLVVSKASIVFLIAGTLVIGLAAQSGVVFLGLFVYTCGSGYLPALRSFMTSLVPRDETALLFTMIGVFESIGALIGSPLLAQAFSAGISKGGILTGLPFYCAAIIYGVSGLSIWWLKAPEAAYRPLGDEDAESDE